MIAPSMAIAAIGDQMATTNGIENAERDHHAPGPQADRLIAHFVADQPPTARRPQPQRAEGDRGDRKLPAWSSAAVR